MESMPNWTNSVNLKLLFRLFLFFIMKINHSLCAHFCFISVLCCLTNQWLPIFILMTQARCFTSNKNSEARICLIDLFQKNFMCWLKQFSPAKYLSIRWSNIGPLTDLFSSFLFLLFYFFVLKLCSEQIWFCFQIWLICFLSHFG